MKLNKTILSILVMCLLYALELFGNLLFGFDSISLTPIVLLISAFILFLNHPTIDTRLVIYMCVVFVASWLIELVGIETSRVFGQYFFGNNLGFKILDVPVIIGIVWLLLSYCSSVIASSILSRSSVLNSIIPKVFLGTILMLLVDFCLEQAASISDFWYWKNQTVPLQNYTAWFAFSFAFNYLFQRLEIDTDNKLAGWVYGFMLLLFVGLGILPMFLFASA